MPTMRSVTSRRRCLQRRNWGAACRKKILLKGLKSRTEKSYDAYIVPKGRKNIIIAKMGRKKAAEGLNLLWSSLKESIQAENGNRVEIVL